MHFEWEIEGGLCLGWDGAEKAGDVGEEKNMKLYFKLLYFI